MSILLHVSGHWIPPLSLDKFVWSDELPKLRMEYEFLAQQWLFAIIIQREDYDEKVGDWKSKANMTSAKQFCRGKKSLIFNGLEVRKTYHFDDVINVYLIFYLTKMATFKVAAFSDNLSASSKYIASKKNV